MSKIPRIHYYKDRRHLINTYYLALLPLIIFSIYKNGILLYTNNLINFSHILIPLYFYIISIIISILISLIFKDSFKETTLICLISASTISLNTNMIIYPILLFVILFIIKYLKSHYKLEFNSISIIHLTLLLAVLLNGYSYLNISETLNKFNYNLFDVFIGHNISGLATSSTLIMIISLIILSLNKFYKKNIAYSAIISYLIISSSYILLTKDYNYLNIILSGSAYFSFIFIAPFIYETPITRKSSLIYGILIGILTSLISIYITPIEASYIVIFILSLFIPILNKIANKKYLKAT